VERTPPSQEISEDAVLIMSGDSPWSGRGVFAVSLKTFAYPRFNGEAARREAEVEHLEQALKRREEARRQAVQELLSQRCTLKETLLRFQALNQEWPDIIVMARVAGAEESDEEIAYRLILQYVQIALSERSEESAAALRRVENDYQQLHTGSPRPIRSSKLVQTEP
jgi:hypothetical protein